MLQGDNEMSIGLIILLIALWVIVICPAICYSIAIADDLWEAYLFSIGGNGFLAIIFFIIKIVVQYWRIPA
jgi:hypothetical protein